MVNARGSEEIWAGGKRGEKAVWNNQNSPWPEGLCFSKQTEGALCPQRPRECSMIASLRLEAGLNLVGQLGEGDSMKVREGKPIFRGTEIRNPVRTTGT